MIYFYLVLLGLCGIGLPLLLVILFAIRISSEPVVQGQNIPEGKP